MWQAWINGSLGLWLIIIAFLQMKNVDCVLNNLFIGIISAIVGWLMKEIRPWQGWSSIVLGGWLIVTLSISDILIGRYHQWNLSFVGVLLAISGFTALGGESNPHYGKSKFEIK